MTRVVETPGGAARVESIVTPPKEVPTMMGISVPVRLARIGYALLSSIFVACVIVQVFFAGMGAFGADWSLHLTFAHFLGLPPLLMAPMAFAGRLSWGLRLLPLGLLILIGWQYAFANAAVPAAALHPVNALLILCLSLLTAGRAWTAVAGRRKR
jgi:Family of unknown function (DUF6220)